MKLIWWMIAGLAGAGAISTILPTRMMPFGATADCMLGYPAHCSFTPVSTIICIAIAGAVLFIGNTNILDEDDSEDRDEEDPMDEDEEPGGKRSGNKKKKTGGNKKKKKN